MAYIKRRGITLSLQILLISLIVMIVFFIQSDWENQYIAINYLGIDFDQLSNMQTALVIFFALSLILAPFWYGIGKIIAPAIGLFVGKFVLAGVGSKPFLDSNVNKRELSMQKYVTRSFNLGLGLFAIDFFLSNNFFYEKAIVIDEINNSIVPTLHGFFIALAIITIFEPVNWLLEDIGLRSFNEDENQIRAVSRILDRLVFNFLRTGSLVASFASITLNSEVIDSIDVYIRIIFVRSFFTAIMISLLFTIFFQPIAIKKSWKNKNVPLGKSVVKFI